MGQVSSVEEEAHLQALTNKLSKIELSDLEKVFQELSSTQDGKAVIKQPTWLNRDLFAEKFGLPDFVVEQMFEAFDRDKNGVIDADEFMMGMALCLHGSINDKCRLLFKMFNLNGDDGISRTELTTVLTSALQSAEMVLVGSLQSDPGIRQRASSQSGEALQISVTVDKIVKDAFQTCDLHKTGKLNVEDFSNWVHKNPRLVNSIFVVQCPKPSFIKQSSVSSAFHEISEPGTPASPVAVSALSDDCFEPGADSSSLTPAPIAGGDLAPVDDPSEAFSKGATSATLLESALENVSKKKLGELFHGPSTSHSVEEQFFDSLPGFADEPLEIGKRDKMEELPRPQSTGDIGQQLRDYDPTSLALGGSEEGIDRLSVSPTKTARFTLFGSPSMQSIALSRDSLAEKSPFENIRHDEYVLQGHEEGPVEFVASPLMPEKTIVVAVPESQIQINLDIASDALSTPLSDSVAVDIYGSSTETDSSRLGDTSFQKDLIEETSATGPMWHPLQTAKPNFVLNDIADGVFEPSQFKSETKLVDLAFASPREQTGSNDVLAADSSHGLKRADLLKDLRIKRSNSVELGVEPEESDFISGDVYQYGAGLSLLYVAELHSRSVGYEFHSYWPASRQTCALFQLVESGQEVQQSLLTFPSALVEGVLGDPIRDLVAKYLGEQEAAKRPVMTLDSVPFTDDGLRKLLQAGCWRAALDFTLKFLSTHGQGLLKENARPYSPHTPKLLQMWFVRIAILMKLRMFSSAEAEANAFGDFDGPDLYYEFYPKLYPGKKGSMVPFSLRLLHAELPQHNGRRNVALDRLYAMLDKVKSILRNLEAGLSEDGISATEDSAERKKLWQARHLRLMYSIGNCFLGMEDYNLAIRIFEEIIKITPEKKTAILSGIGRICLHFGDIMRAQKIFRHVDEVVSGDANSLGMVTMNNGFLALAQGNYDAALVQFQSAFKLDPGNLSACNNASVCLIFLGKVKEACSVLEYMVWRNPDRSLSEEVLFNLCTIYELETSRALQKKHKLLDLVSKHCGDGFNVQCLKLT